MTASLPHPDADRVELTMVHGDKIVQYSVVARFRDSPGIWDRIVNRLFSEAMETGILAKQSLDIRVE